MYVPEKTDDPTETTPIIIMKNAADTNKGVKAGFSVIDGSTVDASYIEFELVDGYYQKSGTSRKQNEKTIVYADGPNEGVYYPLPIKLPAGDYLLIESDPPEGYMAIKPVPLTIETQYSGGGTLVIPQMIHITNYPIEYPPPELKKTVYENSTGEWGKAADAGLGQEVHFRLEADLKDGFNEYASLTFEDELDSGFRWIPTTFKAYCGVDGMEITDSFEVTTTATGFSARGEFDFNGLVLSSKEPIIIEYSAILENPRLVNEGTNSNSATLSYDNSSIIKGTTKPASVDVYSYEVSCLKVDAEDGSPLDGAKFALYTPNYSAVEYKTGIEKTNPENQGWFEYDEETDIYSSTTDDVFDNSKVYYQENRLYYSEGNGFTEVGDSVIESLIDGTLTFSGLDEGRYKLEEVAAPEGYARLEYPLEFIIKSNIDKVASGEEELTYTIEPRTSDDSLQIDVAGEQIRLLIKNSHNPLVLPETGAEGLQFLVIVGLGLIGAGLFGSVAHQRNRKGEKLPGVK